MQMLRTYIKNEAIKRPIKVSNRQSAGVLQAPQRINAKKLCYIIGLFEANGSLTCYKEGQEYIRIDLVIALKVADSKLIYWIKKIMQHGNVKYSYNKDKQVARYIVRSKEHLLDIWFKAFDLYPLLTKNKLHYVNWVKECLKNNQVLPKPIIKSESHLRVYQNEDYIKDWLIGFIEGNGSFYVINLPCGKKRFEFNLSQKGEKELLYYLGNIMGLSGFSEKKGGYYILTAVSLKDVQAVINFMFNPRRLRLKGLKKVKFLLWIRQIRRDPKYATSLYIPNRY